MPNANRPTGLSPVKHLSGAAFTGQATLYCISAANTNAFAIGDPVITDTAFGANAAGVPAVTIATAGVPLRGVIVGIGTGEGLIANPANLDVNTRPAAAQTKDWFVMVVDDPNVIFEVQEIGTGTQFVAADIGLNANLVAGANNGFTSGWLLDNATEAVTGTLQVRLMGLTRRVDNEFGAFAKHLVLINSHELRAGSAGL